MKHRSEGTGFRVQGSGLTPVEMARVLYENDGRLADFRNDLAQYLMHGIVFASPVCFGMFSATLLEDGRAAWWIHVAAGDLRELARVVPCKLPFVAFCRRGENRIRVYDFDKFIARLNRTPPHP